MMMVNFYFYFFLVYLSHLASPLFARFFCLDIIVGRVWDWLGRFVLLGNAAFRFSLQVRGGGTIPAGAVIFKGYLFPILLLTMMGAAFAYHIPKTITYNVGGAWCGVVWIELS